MTSLTPGVVNNSLARDVFSLQFIFVSVSKRVLLYTWVYLCMFASLTDSVFWLCSQVSTYRVCLLIYIDIQRDILTEKHIERDREVETERERDTHTHTHTESYCFVSIYVPMSLFVSLVVCVAFASAL